MQWDGSENSGFSTSPKCEIYIPLDPDPNRPTVAKQDQDLNSLLNYVRGLLKLRKSAAALGNEGGLEFLSDVGQPYPMIYMRRSPKGKYIVAINPSDKSVEAKINAQGADRVTYSFGTTEMCTYKIDKNADVIQLPPISAAVFRLD